MPYSLGDQKGPIILINPQVYILGPFFDSDFAVMQLSGYTPVGGSIVRHGCASLIGSGIAVGHVHLFVGVTFSAIRVGCIYHKATI